MFKSLKVIYWEVFNSLVLFGTSIAFTLVCGEVLVRYTSPQRLYRFPKGMFVNHPTLQYGLTPNFRGTSKTAEYETSIKINSLGLRDDSEYARTSSNRYRMLAVGDSFTMGVGVELEQAYVKVLERLLSSARDERTYEVVNGGVPGYNTHQELTYLQEEGVKLEPDLVLLNFYIGNDILDNFYVPSLSVIDGYLQNGKPPPGLLPSELRTYLIRNSHLYRFIWPYQRQVFGWLFNRPGVDSKKWERETHLSIYSRDGSERAAEMWDITYKKFKEFVDLSKRHSFGPVVVLIPEPVQSKLRGWKEMIEQQGANEAKYARDNPNRMIVELCVKLGIRVLDLLPVFSETDPDSRLYLELDGHWTPKGNALAANAVYEFVKEQYLIGPSNDASKTVAMVGSK